MTRRFLGATAAIVLLLLAMSASTAAHPTASAFVVLHVQDGRTVDVRITANAYALVLTLAALGQEPGRGTGPSGPEHESLRERAADLVRLVELTADGHRINLTWLGSEHDAEREGAVVVRLRGELPAGTTALRWRTALFLGAYPLAVVAGAGDAAPEAYDWLAGREQSRLYALKTLHEDGSPWRRAAGLVVTGFLHIVPAGLDHMLFMIGLFLLATTTRALVWQVSAFTLAHSLTLALGVFGLVSLPAAIVEPLIAASIVFIAIENLVTTRLSRVRLGIVFLFGLLHGLGFAGAMSDLGLSGGSLVASLVGFNAGVELGQLAVIGAAALVVRGLRLSADDQRRYVVRPASAAIALTGVVWAIERAL